MTKYVALLRGINVGGNKKVQMSDLKKAFVKIGLRNIKTILASGNVIFESELESIDKLIIEISKMLEHTFKFPIRIMLMKFCDIEKLIALNPYKAIKVTPQTRLYTTFLSEKHKNKLGVNYISHDKSFKIISVTDNTVFSVLDLSISNTPEAMNALEKIYGQNITTRNWNTVLKIAKL